MPNSVGSKVAFRAAMLVIKHLSKDEDAARLLTNAMLNTSTEAEVIEGLEFLREFNEDLEALENGTAVSRFFGAQSTQRHENWD